MRRLSLKGVDKNIMETSAELIEITTALCYFQAALEGASREGLNPHFKSKYVTLDAVWSCIRPHLKPNGLCIAQDVTSQGNTVSVETRLFHVSGQWMKFGPLVMPLGKLDPQSIGSATTYAKRYSLCAALGIVADIDDDANAAQESNKVKPPEQGKTTTQIITKDQSLELKELLKWLDKSIETKLLTAYAIKSIEELPVTSFVPTLTRLKAMFDEKKVES